MPAAWPMHGHCEGRRGVSDLRVEAWFKRSLSQEMIQRDKAQISCLTTIRGNNMS